MGVLDDFLKRTSTSTSTSTSNGGGVLGGSVGSSTTTSKGESSVLDTLVGGSTSTTTPVSTSTLIKEKGESVLKDLLESNKGSARNNMVTDIQNGAQEISPTEAPVLAPSEQILGTGEDKYKNIVSLTSKQEELDNAVDKENDKEEKGRWSKLKNTVSETWNAVVGGSEIHAANAEASEDWKRYITQFTKPKEVSLSAQRERNKLVNYGEYQINGRSVTSASQLLQIMQSDDNDEIDDIKLGTYDKDGNFTSSYTLTKDNIEKLKEIAGVQKKDVTKLKEDRKLIDAEDVEGSKKYINDSINQSTTKGMEYAVNELYNNKDFADSSEYIQTKLLNYMQETIHENNNRLYNGTYKNLINYLYNIKDGDLKLEKNVEKGLDINTNEKFRNILNEVDRLTDDINTINDNYAILTSLYAQYGDEVKVRNKIRELYPDMNMEGRGDFDINLFSNFLLKDFGKAYNEKGEEIGSGIFGIGDEYFSNYDVYEVVNKRAAAIQEELEDLIEGGQRTATFHKTEGTLSAVGDLGEIPFAQASLWTIGTLGDAASIKAGIQEMKNYNENFEVAEGAEKFANSILGVVPEFVGVVGSFLTPSVVGKVGKISKVNKMVQSNKALGVLLGNKKISDIVYGGSKGLDAIVKAKKLDRRTKLGGEILESVVQDATIFNRLDNDYLSEDEDMWTIMGAGLGAVTTLLGAVTNKGIIRNLKGGAGLRTDNMVIDRLLKDNRDVVQNGGINKLLFDLPYNQSSTLYDLIIDTNKRLDNLVAQGGSKGEFVKKIQKAIVAKHIENGGLSYLKNGTVSGRSNILGLLMQPGDNQVKHMVNSMITDSRYTLPDFLKVVFELDKKVSMGDKTSSIINKSDINKMHNVSYNPILDVAGTRSFDPLNTYTLNDMDNIANNLKRYNNEEYNKLASVFEDTENFIKNGESYTLNEEGLRKLGYTKREGIDEGVIGSISQDTQKFVDGLRSVNEEKGINVYSNDLINGIEETDAFDRIGSMVGKYVC